MPQIIGLPKAQYFDSNGDPLVGGKVYSYAAGTLTLKNTYPTIPDALAATNANANPIILDSRGEANLVIQGGTKLILKDANDVLIYSFDNIGVGSSDIYDSNGNELLKFSETANAVNEWTITNAVTTQAPRFDATGADTNVAGKISSKGSGILYLDGGTTGAVNLNTVSSGQTNVGGALAVTGLTTFTGLATANGGLTVVGAVGVTGNTALTGNLTVSGTLSHVPIGTILDYAATTVPTGFLACDGTAVSRTTYAALFAVISTTWGVGDGSTTFNVPSLARRVTVGKGGSGTATLGNAVANTGGTETETLSLAQIPSHDHAIPYTFGLQGVTVGGVFVNVITAGSGLVTASGSGGSHNNLPPSAIVTKMIRI